MVAAPSCVMPTALMVSVPVPTEALPKMIAPWSVTATLLAPLLFRITAPVKLLAAWVMVMTPAPALNVATPAPAAWVMAPVCVIPTAVIVRVPVPTEEVPRISAF